MARRLTRNTSDAYLGGVATGFADYFDIDPVIARLAFIFLAFLHGSGVILYIICWVVMPAGAPHARTTAPAAPPGGPDGPPEAGSGDTGATTPAGQFAEEVKQAGEKVAEEVKQAGQRVHESFRGDRTDESRGQLIGGAILVGIGLIFLLPRLNLWFLPHWLNLWDLWPVILIVIGASILLRARGGTR